MIQHSVILQASSQRPGAGSVFFIVHLERFAEVGGGFGVVCTAEQGALQMARSVFRL